MLRENYYEILGLPPTANNQDIRKAYTTLALQYHPDKNESEDARDKFEAIQRAYETLSDTRKRSCYDATLYNEVPLSSTSFVGGGVRYPDSTGGGTIITGDGWSFAINLNNVSVSKLVFTFAEDVVDEETFMEHVHIKTDPNSPHQYEPHLRRPSKDREAPPRTGKNRVLSGGKARGSRANSGRRNPNPPGSSGSPNRVGDTRAQTSHDRASNGGGVTSVTVTPKKDAANANRSTNGTSCRTRRRKMPAASGDRLKSTVGNKTLRGVATTPTGAGKRSAQRSSPKKRQNTHPEVKQSMSPSKMTSESRGSLQFARPVPSSRGLMVPGRIGTTLDLKPKLYATRNFVGKITSDKNLFQKKSTTFPVRHTLFAVKSRVFTPLSRMGTKPEIAKRKVGGGGMKRRKKLDGDKRNHGGKMQKKKVVDAD